MLRKGLCTAGPSLSVCVGGRCAWALACGSTRTLQVKGINSPQVFPFSRKAWGHFHFLQREDPTPPPVIFGLEVSPHLPSVAQVPPFYPQAIPRLSCLQPLPSTPPCAWGWGKRLQSKSPHPAHLLCQLRLPQNKAQSRGRHGEGAAGHPVALRMQRVLPCPLEPGGAQARDGAGGLPPHPHSPPHPRRQRAPSDPLPQLPSQPRSSRVSNPPPPRDNTLASLLPQEPDWSPPCPLQRETRPPHRARRDGRRGGRAPVRGCERKPPCAHETRGPNERGAARLGGDRPTGQRLTRTVTKAARGHGWQLCGTRCGQERRPGQRRDQGGAFNQEARLSGYQTTQKDWSAGFPRRRPGDTPLPLL